MTDAGSDDNTRSDPRHVAEVKVDYRSAGSFMTDYAANISKGGIFIKTSLPLPVGERVRLRLTLPGGDAPFALDGVVKWVSTLRDKDKPMAGMGVEFVNFDDEIREKLKALVRAYEA